MTAFEKFTLFAIYAALGFSVIGGCVFIAGGCLWLWQFVTATYAQPTPISMLLSGLAIAGLGSVVFLFAIFTFDAVHGNRMREYRHDGRAR